MEIVGLLEEDFLDEIVCLADQRVEVPLDLFRWVEFIAEAED